MYQSFHREFAHDRRRQLVRDDRLASQLAELRAGERAELEAERRRAVRFEPRGSLLTRLRAALHVRPLGA
jgi:hypothetical protein